MEVNARIYQKVDIDPIDVLEKVNIIGADNWIVKEGKKYIEMTEHSAGSHSFDGQVGEVPKKIYDLYQAKQLLIDYLKEKK